MVDEARFLGEPYPQSFVHLIRVQDGAVILQQEYFNSEILAERRARGSREGAPADPAPDGRPPSGIRSFGRPGHRRTSENRAAVGGFAADPPTCARFSDVRMRSRASGTPAIRSAMYFTPADDVDPPSTGISAPVT